MELSYKEEVGVGAMVLLGLVAFTAGMFWLTGRSIASKGVAARVEFTNVSGLKVGDPVRVSGVRKGRVSEVRLNRVGRVTVTLRLDPEVRPHNDASATVASADFLGAKYIDYNPGMSDTLLAEGEPIKGATEDQFADVASRAATSANELIARMNEGLNPGEIAREIRNTLLATQRGMDALTKAADGPAVRQTRLTLAALERVMARFDTLLGAANPQQTGSRFDTVAANMARLSDRLADATTSLKNFLDRMERGEGTMGKMATDTVLYRNMNETLNSLKALLTDLRERPGRYLTVKVF
jgi:phospholipid/cholesterol/gamma-HCH transport system substrate-binding protein